MLVMVKGYEVYLGADSGTDRYTINIPKLRIFKGGIMTKKPMAILEDKAKELIEQKINNNGTR